MLLTWTNRRPPRLQNASARARVPSRLTLLLFDIAAKPIRDMEDDAAAGDSADNES